MNTESISKSNPSKNHTTLKAKPIFNHKRQKNDDKLREKAIETWLTETERLKPDDIDCDGCHIGKRLYKFCSACEVRKSGLERGVTNCAYCNEYPCKKLEKLWRGFRTVSWKEAKATLDNLRKIKKLA